MTRYRMKGFGRVVWVSALLHAGVAVAVALLFNSEPGRVFINPVQMVDLVAEPGPRQAKPAPQAPPKAEKEKPPAPAEPEKAPEEKPRPAPKPEEAAKIETPKESPAQSVKIKEKEAPKPPDASIDDTLRSITESVKKREDKASVSSKVDEIKKKLEEDEARKDRLKKLRAEIASRESRKPPEPSAQAGPAPAEGRPSGGSVKTFEDKYPAYYTIIKARIDDNWTYPQALRESRVSLIVAIKIARSGELVSASVEVSSGNPVFDESLVSAVWRAAPFPPLPADFEGNFLETGLRFCPGCTQR
ncbi:MAG: cell envelope integrity protein TolA [Thermodesulfobacteriota bacterium]|nr:MAG: cell envelope integrity protein TolA [Thermodesulfobacteriota bacterium]